MPLPTFKFISDKLSPLRQAVPLRYACLAADLSVGQLFEAISNRQSVFYSPILVVYEFYKTNNCYAEVTPSVYEKLSRGLSGILEEDLLLIPPQHFVWSDDLLDAYSQVVDQTGNRETARLYGEGVRIPVALDMYADILEQCEDLSSLAACIPQPVNSIVMNSKQICTITYLEKESIHKVSKGIKYIKLLVQHPTKVYSVNSLDLLVNPSVASDTDESILDDFGNDANGDANYLISNNVASALDDAIDELAIKSYKKRLQDLKEQIEDSKERGDEDKQQELEKEEDNIKKYLIANLNNLGRSRALDSAYDNKRKAILNAITRAINQIALIDEALATHLRSSITTGSSCSYTPNSPVSWNT